MTRSSSSKANWAKLARRCYFIARHDARILERSARNQDAVNLGKFYATEPNPLGGWAYLEDGSIYIQAANYLSHEDFEHRMNLVQGAYHFTSQKSIFYQITHPYFYSRKDFTERIFFKRIYTYRDMKSPEFRHGIIDTDGRLSIPKRLESFNPVLKPLLARALACFRGTLVNGKLQPNVRLGNGLDLPRRNPFTVDIPARIEDQWPEQDQNADRNVRSEVDNSIPEDGAQIKLKIQKLKYEKILAQERAKAARLEKENLVLQNEILTSQLRQSQAMLNVDRRKRRKPPVPAPSIYNPKPHEDSSRRSNLAELHEPQEVAEEGVSKPQAPIEGENYDAYAFLGVNTVPESLVQLNKHNGRRRVRPASDPFPD